MRTLVFLFFSIFLYSCIETANIDYSTQKETLVVKAYFNNKSIQQELNLSYSQPLGTGYNTYPKNVEAYITSLEGEKYDYTYKSLGSYVLEHGVIPISNHHYQLTIIADGTTYQSEIEQMPTLENQVKVDSFYYQEDYQLFFDKAISNSQKEIEYPIGAKKSNRLGLKFMVDFKDTPNQENFYRWSYKNSYIINAQPLEHLLWDRAQEVWIDDPIACCNTCYYIEYGNTKTLENDKFKDGNNLKGVQVAFFPYHKYMDSKMKLKVYQHQISKTSYEFHKNLNIQLAITGSMFDPPPAEIHGNIVNINNPEDKAIGIFEVSSTTELNLEILGSTLPETRDKFNYAFDCRDIEGTTTSPTEEW